MFAEQPNFQDLRNRISQLPKDVVFVTGAGFSRAEAGLPLWGQLKALLVEEAKRRALELREEDKPGALASLASIENVKDLWVCFQLLLEHMGGAGFRTAVQRLLDCTGKTGYELYSKLWRLNVKGLITFNLDCLPLDAYASERKRYLRHATGRQPALFSGFLGGLDEFCLFPHGFLPDQGSWVFHKSARDEVLGTGEYRSFWNAALVAKTLVIVGFEPRDVSFEAQLLPLASLKAGLSHYILTSDRSLEGRTWLEDWHLKPIYYTASSDGEHAAAYRLFLDELLGFVPAEPMPPPAYRGAAVAPSAVPGDRELVTMAYDRVRAVLNSVARHVLTAAPLDERGQCEAIESIFTKYRRSIQVSWLTSDEEGDDTFFGYQVQNDSVGSGAFGRVMKLVDTKTGEPLAAKVLIREVSQDVRYLLSFRRGIQSMRILNEHGFNDVVKIVEAYDFPPTIIMEFIPGPTLTQAVERGYLKSLDVALSVLMDIGGVVHRAHSLPEMVLHRDLKPDNVILRDAEKGDPSFSAVVLDFDLSWHQGIRETLSVFHGARSEGYAAPEQTPTGRDPRASTRNAGVDVYGFGMLAFFVLTGKDPAPGCQNLAGFRSAIEEEIRARFGNDWHAVASYLAELVFRCTRDVQASRPALGDVVAQLEAVGEISRTNRIPSSSRLLPVEIGCRLQGMTEITATDWPCTDTRSGNRKITVTSEPRGSKWILRAEIQRVRTEYDDRNPGTLRKYLLPRVDRAVSCLRCAGWEASADADNLSLVQIRASADKDGYHREDILALVRGLDEASAALI